MSGLSSFEGAGAAETAGDSTGTAFAQTMSLVAAAVASFTLGAFLGQHLGEGASWAAFLLGFLAIVGLNWVRDQPGVAVSLLLAAGLLLGLGIGGGLDAYAEAAPGSVWQAAAATALFVAALGAVGFATQADLSGGYRLLFFCLLGLIIFGLVSLFVEMPGGNVVYALLGLGIFGGYTVLDFNRLRAAGVDEAPSLAVGIFLDVINVFLLFLRLFGIRSSRG